MSLISHHTFLRLQAKKFVEEAPKVLKEGVPKDEAKKLKELFESLGCKITLE